MSSYSSKGDDNESETKVKDGSEISLLNPIGTFGGEDGMDSHLDENSLTDNSNPYFSEKDPGDGGKKKNNSSGNNDEDKEYNPRPRDGLPAFPDAGKGQYYKPSGRWRWTLPNGKILEWDKQHGHVEKYDKSGKPGSHLGSFDPNTGEQTGPAISNRSTPTFAPPDPKLVIQTGTVMLGTWLLVKGGELLLTIVTDGATLPLLLAPL